jgi:Disulphide bond corrector protein DsbC
LDDAAHGVVPSHEVFQKPLKVNLQFEDHPVPPFYRHYPGGEKLGRTMRVWKVQTKTFPEVDPGLVSDPYGFADSPDAEVISSGLNSKGPDSVALGRHGNFFLWGFSAPPEYMTPEARKCFVNAVCYIKKFDGQKPIVRKIASGREWALFYAGYLKQYPGQDFIKQMFPPAVLDRLKNDPEKLVIYYRDHLEYLIPFNNGFAVDEDVVGLGLSNRKVELLEKCVALLEKGEQEEKALRVLRRYTQEGFSDAQRWRSWLNVHRDRLFFSDTGGFKFLVAPDYLVEPLRRGRLRPVARDASQEPEPVSPVVATAELSPATARRGQRAVITIRVKMAPPWHIYAAQGSSGPGVATTLKLELPAALESLGDWSYPKPIPASDNQMTYEGAVEFRRELRVRPDAAAGRVSVTCDLGYQACDPVSCRPPIKLQLAVPFEIVAAMSPQ